ncbi:rod-binding protein [Methyloversatilis discipulorum]|jgi:flagellar protein FlgJ|uniref:rod-binding protein n=1 Tax=Methyloversatilis discipulorum TaxID=1119528 RepID=UPI0003679276|nr:rod-binding protein [Methyloversatilis discipulorum]
MNVHDIASSAATVQTEAQPALVAPQVDPALLKKATEAAVKFESFFISETLRQMRRSTREMAGEDSIFKDRVNEDMLDLADGLVADAMASQRAFGIADMLLRQLLPQPAPVAFNASAPAVASVEGERAEGAPGHATTRDIR